MESYKVIFKPNNIEVDVLEGSTVMQAMDKARIALDSPCGGSGRCGKCRVKILTGTVQPTTVEQEILSEKDLREGIRLACLTKVYSNITVEFLNSEKLRSNILISSDGRTVDIKPHIRKVFVEVHKPSLGCQKSDWRRLKDSLAEQGYDCCDKDVKLSMLRNLPQVIREGGCSLTSVMHEGRIVGIEKQDTTETMLGMAFDIGTTTIVGYLMDLYSGRELYAASMLNPQARFGADVISRVAYTIKWEDGLDKLHRTVIEAINTLIGEAAKKAGVSKKNIYGISIAANTCMHHIFLGISPLNVSVAPYVPAVSEPLVISASELKIDINESGKVFMLPNIAGFIGADTTAVLLAEELDKCEDIKLVIDIGTNGEIALGSSKGIAACSTSAGPAFEGANISCGMRGAAGAIDHVYFREDVEYSVIGGGRPSGICGSGLLDIVAGLLELGIIDKRGRILQSDRLTNPEAEKFKHNIIKYEGEMAFLLANTSETGDGRQIFVTQRDIRELQLAKGAMAAGIRILMGSAGIGAEDIKEVLLAGAFGNYLNPRSACVIGLIPQELESKIKMIGNAAGTGAKIAMLSSSEYKRAESIASLVKFIELGSHPKFNSIFAECSYFNR